MKEYNMLIASLVGIVAIVGLVTFFSGNTTGAYNLRTVQFSTARDSSYPLAVNTQHYDTGISFGKECSQVAQQGGAQCCSDRCWTYCPTQETGSEVANCMRICTTACSKGSRMQLLR